MADCIFCEIVQGNMQADIVFRDDELVAFRDINPQAPTHILVIPTRHIDTLNDLEPRDEPLIGKLVSRARALAQEEGIAERGYRLVMNCNREAGQTVFHIHVHLLGGRAMGWPPG
ncbi:MAG: histidine triad nucleotide-binding protein [Calditrichaeota bacterium]|nr:MAG: histidine triad nucleotide-binding protein [Calditrichota bacterium]